MNNRTLGAALLAGATLLLVVHGLGRFIYTPLLPYLVADGVLTLEQGASVASWNFLGYLLGALLALRWHRVAQIRQVLPWALLLHLSSSLAQVWAEQVELLGALRLLNGIANGLVFVQVPALILEWLARHNRTSSSGLVYLGVGAGLLLSSAMVALPASWLHGSARWWPAALASLPLAWWGWRRISQLDVATHEQAKGSSAPPGALFDRASVPLFLAYAGAGLGYILPMTFLPMLASLQGQAKVAGGAWLLTALATLPSPWLWNHLGARLGDKPALLLNFTVQLAGVLAALLLPVGPGTLICGLLVGATFLGTVLLTQRLARSLHPHQGPRLSAAMIALYGLAQLAGPWLAGLWLSPGGSLQSTLWLGAGALLWGLLWMLPVPTRRVATGA